jgi:DNA-binding transcriptional regulator YiaG
MAINMNNHVFKGHKTLLGSKYVTYGEVELPSRYELFSKSKSGFDWGTAGSGAIQLSFSMLFQLSNFDIASRNATKYAMDTVSHLNSRDWLVTAQDVLAWLELNEEKVEEKPVFKIEKRVEEKAVFKIEDVPEIKLIKRVAETTEEPKAEETPKIKLIKRVAEAVEEPKTEETALPKTEETLTQQKEPVQLELLVLTNPVRKVKKAKTNVVKSICQELHITQKHLAEILEVPEGTVSSWAVKNEIPRLGKKAIEFYALSTKNQKIVDSYRSFVHLLDVS